MYANTMTFPQFAVLVLAFMLIVALAAYEWMTRARPVPLDAQTMSEDAAVHTAISFAVRDCALEYVTVTGLGYSNRDARAHVRAHIAYHYSTYNNGIRATIQRKAIQAARDRIYVYDQMNIKDINGAPTTN